MDFSTMAIAGQKIKNLDLLITEESTVNVAQIGNSFGAQMVFYGLEELKLECDNADEADLILDLANRCSVSLVNVAVSVWTGAPDLVRNSSVAQKVTRIMAPNAVAAEWQQSFASDVARPSMVGARGTAYLEYLHGEMAATNCVKDLHIFAANVDEALAVVRRGFPAGLERLHLQVLMPRYGLQNPYRATDRIRAALRTLPALGFRLVLDEQFFEGGAPRSWIWDTVRREFKAL